MIGIGDLVDSTEAIAAWVAETAGGPGWPLVIGGDCSLLPGVFAGLRRAGIEAGLWMIDGHPDAYDGASSPSGEAADMELTFLLGRAPPALAAVWGGDGRPLLDPRRVAVLGHRPAGFDPEVARELGGVPEGVSYPQPHGLDWETLAQLARLLATAPGLVGISVADLEPERDPDGAHTRRVVAFLGELLT